MYGNFQTHLKVDTLHSRPIVHHILYGFVFSHNYLQIRKHLFTASLVISFKCFNQPCFVVNKIASKKRELDTTIDCSQNEKKCQYIYRLTVWCSSERRKWQTRKQQAQELWEEIMLSMKEFRHIWNHVDVWKPKVTKSFQSNIMKHGRELLSSIYALGLKI